MKINLFKTIKEKYDYITKEFSNSDFVTENSNLIYFGIDSLDNYLFPISNYISKDFIFPLRKMQFENLEIYAPNKPEEYINFQYKNYLLIPKDIEIAPELSKRVKIF